MCVYAREPFKMTSVEIDLLKDTYFLHSLKAHSTPLIIFHTLPPLPTTINTRKLHRKILKKVGTL